MKISVVGSSTARRVPSVPLFQHKRDLELPEYNNPDGSPGVRNCASDTGGCPAVFVLQEGYKTEVTRDWQYYIRAINYAMAPNNVSALFGPTKAFCNRKPDDLRADWILEENLTKPNPDFDKVRTCAGSVLTGTVNGTDFLPLMFDGTKPPPLKPGRTYPQRIQDVKLDDYLFDPRQHRWLFLVATNVRSKGSVFPFDNGGLYDWTGDRRPYTFLPHISKFPVRYPVSRVTALPLLSPIPSPYYSA